MSSISNLADSAMLHLAAIQLRERCRRLIRHDRNVVSALRAPARSRSGVQSRCPWSSSPRQHARDANDNVCVTRQNRTEMASRARRRSGWSSRLSIYGTHMPPNAQRPPAFGQAGVWLLEQALSYLSCCVGLVPCGALRGSNPWPRSARYKNSPGLAGLS